MWLKITRRFTMTEITRFTMIDLRSDGPAALPRTSVDILVKQKLYVVDG